MAIDQNNSQVNSFVKGMNSDTSLDMVSQDQYVFGQNIRITNNALLSALIDSNSTEGIVTPINEGTQYTVRWAESGDGVCVGEHNYQMSSILAVASIGNSGAVIVKDTNKKWHIIKVDLNEEEKVFTLNNIFDSSVTTDKDRFSVVINKELKNVTKLYIADGVHEVMQLNIDPTNICYLLDNDPYKLTEDELISGHLFPTKKIQILKQISGTLKTQQVQYTYRYYNKYGVSSRVAPITNRLQIIDSNRNKETGNAENTTTSIGLQLNIPETEYFQRVFDHIQVFRVSYVVATQTPEIALIYDAAIDQSMSEFTLNDTGLKPLQEMSIDEFNALSGQSIVPQIIEQNQNYMFAANIKDETVIRVDSTKYDAKSFSFDKQGYTRLYRDGAYDFEESYRTSDIPGTNISDTYYVNKYSDINIGGDVADEEKFAYDKSGYYGGSGNNISWRFVVTPIEIHSECVKVVNKDGKRVSTINANEAPAIPAVYQNSNMYYITKDNKLDKTNLPSDTDAYFNQHSIYTVSSLTYNDTTTSSLLRSLKRDDVYRYGIVFYDKFGAHSDTLWIADIRTPKIKDIPTTAFAASIDEVDINNDDLTIGNKNLYALSLGIEFKVKKPTAISDNEIVGYQIVRCEKTVNTTKNILQVATSKPVHQYLWGFEEDKIFSPYYPSGFITTQDLSIVSAKKPTIGFGVLEIDDSILDGWCYANIEKREISNLNSEGTYRGYSEVGQTLLQLYSADTLFYRDDVLSLLSQIDLKISPLYYSYGENINQIDALVRRSYVPETQESDENDLEEPFEFKAPFISYGWYTDVSNVEYMNLYRQLTRTVTGDKSSSHLTLHNYFNTNTVYNNEGETLYFGGIAQESPYQISIKEVSDVKNPLWEEGFSNLQFDGSEIHGGVKQYKSYVSSVGSDSYVNWACSGMYDLRIGRESQLITSSSTWQDKPSAFTEAGTLRSPVAWGWIGPGPVCLLCQIDKTQTKPFDGVLRVTPNTTGETEGSWPSSWQPKEIGTIIANIYHTAIQFAGITKQEHQYDTYYGFGNFKTFDNQNSRITVYDGDIYIVPCEFVGMYKAYDFNSIKDTLVSNQILHYIPLETKVNTFFDYGMNYRNTANTNLQLEPGRISGIASQERAMHQYNSIYSDNNTSNDVFVAQSEESIPTDFPQRIMYSQLKINGESVDNWQVFKSVDYIDVDSRYGELTNLLTVKDIIYYWQDTAFGKLSVNERSLINDQNNNTIQLGQAGVLQRNDYIDTKYGMREQDFSATDTEAGIFWIDILNKAVVAYTGGQCVNYGEYKNVQNIINSYITADYRPTIHYDLQNSELSCAFLKIDKDLFKYEATSNIQTEEAQLVFNLKLGLATALYTRQYLDIISLNNVLFGISLRNDTIDLTKYNYIEETENSVYLSPTIMSFVVNTQPSNAKVFDTQKVVTVKRNSKNEWDEQFTKKFLNDKLYTFTTDLNYSFIGQIQNVDTITDREGNILYPIPRYVEDLNGFKEYGQRMRGKWMRVDVRDDNPQYNYSVSHIITKFRQSFS